MFLVSILLIFPNILRADSDYQMLSKQVIELRKEVEIINDEYKSEREKALSEIKALSIQKAELASNIRNEEIRKKQFSDKISQLRKQITDSSVESDKLEPLVQQTMESLVEWVQNSLPFKKEERLETIDSLKQRLKRKEVTSMKVANNLWALIEDEKRLARETSLHKQTIPIEGKMHLAEIVKVGMLFLYFKTDQGKVGMAEKVDNEWVYKTFDDETKELNTLTFFESLKKQIRQGYFEIPTRVGS